MIGMRQLIRTLIALWVVMVCVLPKGQCAEEPPTAELDVRELAEQVDVLQLIVELDLKKGQMTYFAAKADAQKQIYEELRKREESVFLQMKEPLLEMKKALESGKEIPDTERSAVSAKLKELQEIKQRGWQEFQSAVSSCVQLLDEGQVRRITRSPEAVRRANQMVQRIRASSEKEWPKTLDEIASDLLEVKKLDKQAEWQAESDKLQGLTGEERDKALKHLESRKEADTSEMRTTIVQMLTNVRTADERVLSVAVNNLASAVRPKAEVQMQLFAMVSRILDSPAGATALRARLATMNAASEESAPQP